MIVADFFSYEAGNTIYNEVIRKQFGETTSVKDM
jgi:hypothetical protein